MNFMCLRRVNFYGKLSLSLSGYLTTVGLERGKLRWHLHIGNPLSIIAQNFGLFLGTDNNFWAPLFFTENQISCGGERGRQESELLHFSAFLIFPVLFQPGPLDHEDGEGGRERGAWVWQPSVKRDGESAWREREGECWLSLLLYCRDFPSILRVSR